MRWGLVLVGVLALLTVPATTAVTYPQAGYDAGRTGDVPFDLPRANDTAFEEQLPGTPTGTVAVNGSTAYVVTLDHGFEVENETLDSNALWSIDLDTAEVTKRFEIFDERPDWSTAFTDGERVYTQVERQVTAYTLGGEELWTWTVPNRLPQAEHVTCFNDPAFRQGTMYLACLEVRDRYADTPTGGSQETEEVPHTNLVLGALHTGTGEEAWRWFQSADNDPGNQTAGGTEGGREEQTPAETHDVVNAEVTATDNRVFVYGVGYDRDDRAYSNVNAGLGEVGTERYTRAYTLWGLGTEDGAYEIHERGNVDRYERDNAGPLFSGETPDEVLLDAKPAATLERVYLQWNGGVEAIAPDDATHLWFRALEGTDVLSRDGSQAIGAQDRTVVAASNTVLTRLDETAPDEPTWTTALDPTEPIAYGTDPVLLDEDTAVVETLWHEPGVYEIPRFNRSGFGLRAVDLDSGELLWDHGFFTTVGSPQSRYLEVPDFFDQGFSGSTPGFAPGLVVAAAPDGHVEVLGKTPLSMDGPDVDTERFPDAGETVTVDLSDTEPGAFGEATRYRVEWGDGTATPWREDPVFTHAYQEEGNVTARMFAGNDENQTTSTVVTMRVGQTEPNFVETAFKQENQDLTFGVLGVALALGGGLIGVGRRYRKRSRLQEELDALEAGFEERRDRPAECEAFLDDRKDRARGLALGNQLSEEQGRILEDRVEELKRKLRLEAVEDDFDFLPYRLVKAAREMLEDARVSSLERDAFLKALEEDDVLTDEQKTQVRERIEQWFARDSGG